MRKDTSVAPYQLSTLENLKNDPFGFVVMGYYSKKHIDKQREYAENSVRQPNELTRGYYKCSAIAQKLFVVTVAEFLKQNKTKKDRLVSLELADVIYGLNISDGSRTRDLFKKSVNEVADLNVIMQDDEHAFYRINLFETVHFNWDWGTLKFEVSEKFAEFLEAEHKTGFTIFNLEDTGKLQSFYAIRYYEIALSFYGFKGECPRISKWAEDHGVDKKKSWFFAYSVEQLRALFRIENDKYLDPRNLKKKVVLAPIEELNEKIKTFSIKVETVYKQRKIQGFIFWVSDTNEKKLEHHKNETPEERNEINEINKDSEELECYKKKYPKEFEQALIEVKGRNPNAGFRFSLFDESEAAELLKERGYKI